MIFDYTAARNYQRQKQEKLKAERLDLWQQAKQDCEKIINIIIEKYQPKRIIQWGSLLESKHFSEASDIDLAVEIKESLIAFNKIHNLYLSYVNVFTDEKKSGCERCSFINRDFMQ